MRRAAEVILNNGEVALLRPIRPDDLGNIEELVASMLCNTVYKRFFQRDSRLSWKELEKLGQADQQSRVVLIVEVSDRVIGVVDTIACLRLTIQLRSLWQSVTTITAAGQRRAYRRCGQASRG